MGEIKQANFRIDEDTAKNFRSFCEEMGMNQAQGFDHIMQVVELNKAKVGIEGRLTEITTFEEYVKKIMESYLTSLQIAQNTEERVREDFKRDILLRDKALADSERKIMERDEKIVLLTTEMQETQKTAKEAQKTAENAVKQAESATQIAEEKGKVNNMLSGKLAEAEEKLAGYDELKASEESLKQKINNLTHEIEMFREKFSHVQEQYDNSIKKLNDSEKEVMDFKEKISELKSEISSLRRDVEEEKRSSAQKLAEQIRESEQNKELAVERAIVSTEKSMQEEINKLRDEKIRLEVKIEILQKERIPAEKEN